MYSLRVSPPSPSEKFWAGAWKKAKINLSLYTPREHMGGVDVQLHSFLNLALVGWLTSRPGRFTLVPAAQRS